ncbi:uncharacterized protein CEXT_163121 [Caerostris extrusa]|uniref:Uncharacterized protein n=1 Tax=Caerostris extrusa TaxID=172846 RepID=A0AAV4Y7Q3_CAEEX|nr:uncharacterized protein CEXT_163121 [Caerostris extrusa]
MNSDSTFNQSSTTFKEECLTDAEYMSEEEGDRMLRKYSGSCVRRLSGGLSVIENPSAVKDAFSHKQSNFFSSNIAKSFSNTIFLKSIPSLETSTEDSPLMTCLEFLKSDAVEDGFTDVEELSMESDDNKESYAMPVHNLSEMSLNNLGHGNKNVTEDSIRHRRKEDSGATQICNRKSSWTVELLPEDETAEWTETDESGCVRQVTVVKTETSINFEGDDAVKALRKVPEKEASDTERKGSTDSEQDDLSFTEKKSYFQRLSLTTDTLPCTDKWTHDVSLDDLPMAEGEIKREKQDQPTVYRYDFTKNGKDKPVATEFVFSELEKAEEIVKQVNEEIIIEESRLNDSISHAVDRDNVESDLNSAITLEKVEQEVYSLIAEVDKEEKELSKNYCSSMGDSATGSTIDDLAMRKLVGDKTAESEKEVDESSIHSEMGDSFLSSEKNCSRRGYYTRFKS